MRYYSIKAFSRRSIQYETPLILIEPGMNAFTVTTPDIDSLVRMLRQDGVRVDEVNSLDGGSAHAEGDEGGAG